MDTTPTKEGIALAARACALYVLDDCERRHIHPAVSEIAFCMAAVTATGSRISGYPAEQHAASKEIAVKAFISGLDQAIAGGIEFRSQPLRS